ncbi:MAG: UDP-galactopyranose mutase [Synechococcaceae cyanobacterium]
MALLHSGHQGLILVSDSVQPPYDLLVVGAGMYGSCFARLAADRGKRVLVIDRRHHVGGNCYTELCKGIHIHRYGPHIFHTSNPVVWRFVRRFAAFNHFVNSPLAIAQGQLYSLPFNMYTFRQLWGVLTPEQARAKLREQRVDFGRPPENLEEQALALVGPELYERLIRGYTKKQWQKDPRDLPADIIRRTPLRFTYDCNYYNDSYQGIPVDGYTQMFLNMLSGLEVRLGVDFFSDRAFWESQASLIVYTGRIDEFFGHEYGDLEYRSLEFRDHWLNTDNAQGNAVINYCDEHIPFTRKIEHRHFAAPAEPIPVTVVTEEHPVAWSREKTPYYPINSQDNQVIYDRYRKRANAMKAYVFGGRLAEYKYYDMHAVVAAAMLKAQSLGIC